MRNKIRPTVDCVFKAIFGKKENRNLLINFLNAVLGPEEGKRITKVTLLNPYNEREFENGKLSVVDVKAQDESGKYYQIEVQLSVASWLALRMLHNWAGIYHPQLEKGKEYDSLNPVISIWILEGVLFRPEKPADEKDYLHLAFEARERSLGFPMSDHFGIHILQLPYWSPKSSVEDDKERWIHFLKEGENMDADRLPEGMDTEEMRQAFGVLDSFANNREEYFLYLSRLDAIRQERTWKSAVRRAREEVQKVKEQALKEVQRVREQTLKEAQRVKEQTLKEAQKEAQRVKEQVQREKEEALEQAQREKEQLYEQARKEKERFQKEREELMKLLKQAGIKGGE